MSPFAELSLVLLAAMCLLLGSAIILAPARLRPATGSFNARALPLVAGQRRRAAQAGIRPQVWAAGMAGGALVGTILGALSGVTVLAAVGLVAGLCALPFAMDFYIDQRLTRSMRTYVDLLRELRNRMVQMDVPLDVALLDVARSPSARISPVLRPLLQQKSISAALQEVADQGQNPVAESVCSLLLLARSRDHRLLVKLVDGVILPAYEESLEVAESAAITLNGARFTSFLLIVFETGLIAVTTRVPSIASFYNTAPGAAALLLSTLAFFLSVSGIRAAVARPDWPHWDVRTVVRELRNAGT